MIIRVKVHPKSKQVRVQKGESNEAEWVWEVWVKSSPEKNKANEETLRVLSNELKTPKSKIVLVSGLKSRIKRFRVDI